MVQFINTDENNFKCEHKKLYIKSEIEDPFSLLNHIMVNSPPSYLDKACTRTQCNSGRKRSLSDLYTIINSQTKFNISYLHLLVMIYDIMKQTRLDRNYQFLWCTQVKKPVLSNNKSNPKLTMVTAPSKRNYLDSVGVDGISLKFIEQTIENFRHEN